MLTAVPKQPFSWSYLVGDGTSEVARVQLDWLRPQGSLRCAGSEWHVARQGFFSGAYELREGKQLVASARPSGGFGRTFEVDAGREHYTLKPASLLTRAWVLTRGKRELGAIRPMGLFSRQALVDFDESVPIELQLFLLWLALSRWKRQSA